MFRPHAVRLAFILFWVFSIYITFAHYSIFITATIINTKKVKSLLASFSTDSKNVYSIDASNQFSVMGKKSIIAALKTKLFINTPTKRLVAISGSADYRQDKLLKTYASVSIHRLLKKPATLQGTLSSCLHRI